LYLTNGSGSPDETQDENAMQGGGIYCHGSGINVINCRIMHNDNAVWAAGMYLDESNAYLAGTVIAYNHGTIGAALSIIWSTAIFDPINRCSIYMNMSAMANDINLTGANNPNIILDKFTVANPDAQYGEYIMPYLEEPYTFACNSGVIDPQFADFYVSPQGNDQNSGLTPNAPLRSIALALVKIQADSLHPHSIHLADGVYSNIQNGQAFPLNLKSYVSIVGDSEANTIYDGEHRYSAMHGWNSEQGMVVRNLTIQNASMTSSFEPYMMSIISRRHDSNGRLIYFSLEVENVTVRNCVPLIVDDHYYILRFTSPKKLILKHITIENCQGHKP
jgi:hypothetical protein